MTGKRIIILLAVILGVLHQDFWNWDDSSLVFEFMPIGLFYHAMYSIIAAILWAFAIKCAWPSKLVDWAEQDQDDEPVEEGS